MVKTTVKIENYEKHFGIIVIEKEFISSEDLIEALKLGEEILLYEDKITAIQIDDDVKTLFKQIKVAKRKNYSKIAKDMENP